MWLMKKCITDIETDDNFKNSLFNIMVNKEKY